MAPLYVIGAGGIGCAVGYALAAAGASVVFVDADPEKVRWGNRHGVQVERRPPLPALFRTFSDWEPAPGAILFLCTKCYDNAAVLARLSVPVNLIPVQNGFDPALEAHGHRLEGIASFVSECYPHHTRTRITRRGALHFGPRDGTPAEPPSDLVALLRGAGLYQVKPVPSVLPYKYTKLMYNAAISPLAAAAGIDNGQLLAVRSARQWFFDLLRENYAILRGASVPLGKVGPFHPATVSRILDRRRLAAALAWAFYPSLRGTYCSMSGDLPAGRTEIDYYNGRLIKLAGDRPCPLNRRVYELVRRMERQRLSPGLQRLKELDAWNCRTGT